MDISISKSLLGKKEGSTPNLMNKNNISSIFSAELSNNFKRARSVNGLNPYDQDSFVSMKQHRSWNSGNILEAKENKVEDQKYNENPLHIVTENENKDNRDTTPKGDYSSKTSPTSVTRAYESNAEEISTSVVGIQPRQNDPDIDAFEIKKPRSEEIISNSTREEIIKKLKIIPKKLKKEEGYLISHKEDVRYKVHVQESGKDKSVLTKTEITEKPTENDDFSEEHYNSLGIEGRHIQKEDVSDVSTTCLNENEDSEDGNIYKNLNKKDQKKNRESAGQLLNILSEKIHSLSNEKTIYSKNIGEKEGATEYKARGKRYYERGNLHKGRVRGKGYQAYYYKDDRYLTHESSDTDNQFEHEALSRRNRPKKDSSRSHDYQYRPYTYHSSDLSYFEQGSQRNDPEKKGNGNDYENSSYMEDLHQNTGINPGLKYVSDEPMYLKSKNYNLRKNKIEGSQINNNQQKNEKDHGLKDGSQSDFTSTIVKQKLGQEESVRYGQFLDTEYHLRDPGKKSGNYSHQGYESGETTETDEELVSYQLFTRPKRAEPQDGKRNPRLLRPIEFPKIISSRQYKSYRNVVPPGLPRQLSPDPYYLENFTRLQYENSNNKNQEFLGKNRSRAYTPLSNCNVHYQPFAQYHFRRIHRYNTHSSQKRGSTSSHETNSSYNSIGYFGNTFGKETDFEKYSFRKPVRQNPESDLEDSHDEPVKLGVNEPIYDEQSHTGETTETDEDLKEFLLEWYGKCKHKKVIRRFVEKKSYRNQVSASANKRDRPTHGSLSPWQDGRFYTFGESYNTDSGYMENYENQISQNYHFEQFLAQRDTWLARSIGYTKNNSFYNPSENQDSFDYRISSLIHPKESQYSDLQNWRLRRLYNYGTVYDKPRYYRNEPILGAAFSPRLSQKLSATRHENSQTPNK
ncbi:hypothetical protein BB560_004447 [Smittium megazygosporum]|uniref:Uncharacterized protein n=1 Tax=Smittium megazygosporum TaxID=133381 RepID=A0A2T9Z9C6_9FUNG|nr:hypothetical protein BB560_004447 [Smittium megazygosporum]